MTFPETIARSMQSDTALFVQTVSITGCMILRVSERAARKIYNIYDGTA